MYEVGPWFVYLMNLAILAIVAMIVLIYMRVKDGQYLREAEGCIQAEIIMPTGHSKFYTVKCGVNDEWIEVAGGRYKLNKDKREWGLHPRLPFMGIRSLQRQIRKETWYLDNPDPAHKKVETPAVTAAEIKAMVREAAAITAGAEAVELQARQKQMVEAIANQPNKTVVYVLLAGIAIGLLVLAVRLFMGMG
jgi:hypothetical protein